MQNPGNRLGDFNAGVCIARSKTHSDYAEYGRSGEHRQDAAANGISLETVEFVIEPSEQYLPRCQAAELDLVLIDGKQAFPWPILDWFFTADKLKQEGLMVLDDLQMSSVSMLGDFLREDPRWEVARKFGRRTLVMRKKVSGSVNDVAWHMQPYITRRYGRKARLLNALGIDRGPTVERGTKKGNS